MIVHVVSIEHGLLQVDRHTQGPIEIPLHLGRLPLILLHQPLNKPPIHRRDLDNPFLQHFHLLLLLATDVPHGLDRLFLEFHVMMRAAYERVIDDGLVAGGELLVGTVAGLVEG